MKNLKLLSVCLVMMGLLFTSYEKKTLSVSEDIKIISEENQNPELAVKIPEVQVVGNDRYVTMSSLNKGLCNHNGWKHYWLDEQE